MKCTNCKKNFKSSAGYIDTKIFCGDCFYRIQYKLRMERFSEKNKRRVRKARLKRKYSSGICIKDI